MNRADVIRMAREAGFNEKQWSAMTYDSGPYEITTPTLALERFANLIAAAKQEECAKVCESKIDAERQSQAEEESRRVKGEGAEIDRLRHWSDVLLWNSAHEQMASAIRALK